MSAIKRCQGCAACKVEQATSEQQQVIRSLENFYEIFEGTKSFKEKTNDLFTSVTQACGAKTGDHFLQIKRHLLKDSFPERICVLKALISSGSVAQWQNTYVTSRLDHQHCTEKTNMWLLKVFGYFFAKNTSVLRLDVKADDDLRRGHHYFSSVFPSSMDKDKSTLSMKTAAEIAVSPDSAATAPAVQKWQKPELWVFALMDLD